MAYKSFTITLKIDVPAADEDEALEIARSFKAAIEHGTPHPYTLDCVVIDKLEEL